MITEIVFFSLPEGISRDELMSKYMSTVEAWSKNEDLVEKHYIYDADGNRGGGVYIWKSKEAMLKWHGSEYRSRIKALYGSEPEMSYFDSLIHVNNLQGKIDTF